MWQFILVVCAILISTLLFLTQNSRSKDSSAECPSPGIFRTIVGLVTMSDNIHVLFALWGRKYGPIFTVYLGTQKYFILNTVATIKEAFGNPELNGRPILPPMDPFQEGIIGLVNGTGVKGAEHRKFVLNSLKRLGFNRELMRTQIEEEMREMVNTLKKYGGQPVDLKKHFYLQSVNAFWMIVANHRLTSSEDEESIAIMKNYVLALEMLTRNPLCAHPTLFYRLPWLSVWKKFRETHSKVTDYAQKLIDTHRISRVAAEPRDFIDDYLDKVDETTDVDSVFYKGKNLPALIVDFILAGSDTSSIVMEWSTIHLARNPNIQKEIREHIKLVVGQDRLLTIADRSSLPILEAFIWEVLRISTPIVLGIQHYALDDVHVNGITIPKDSNVFANIYASHQDPELWRDPGEFRPSRFLTSGGELDRRVLDNIVPFSFGGRMCLGRDIALDTLFLLVGGLVQNYIVGEHKDHPVTLETCKGLLNTPKNCTVVLTHCF